MSKKLISIILPIYNEEIHIKNIYIEIKNIIKNLNDTYNFEIIFVNDGSEDNSWNEIVKLCQNDKNTIGINFSRNFGKEIALTAGIEKSNGDAVITIDADGQHPVDKLTEFIKMWEKGYEIVYNIRPKIKGASFVKKFSSKIFYKLFNSISNIKIESGTTDYRLLDKKVVEIFLNFKEKNRLYRGIIDMIGFNKYCLIFDSLPNLTGRKPSYNYFKLYNLAIDSITSFSIFPLKFVGYIGFIVTVISILLFIVILIDKIGILNIGFSNLIILVVLNTIFIGIILISLGLIALYIARIHEEVMGRPLYIIKDKINLK